MQKSSSVENTESPRHKKQMHTRGRDSREKTAESLLGIMNVKLREGEVNRFGLQKLIDDQPEGRQQTRAHNNMGQIFRA